MCKCVEGGMVEELKDGEGEQVGKGWSGWMVRRMYKMKKGKNKKVLRMVRQWGRCM